jgi:hypothetical protein
MGGDTWGDTDTKEQDKTKLTIANIFIIFA